MKISKQEVSKIAGLARLEIEEQRLELFAEQFNDILDYMDKLEELDTSRTEPLYSPLAHSRALRTDEVHSKYSREEVLQNAPEERDGFFVVPKVF
ncbi:MAG: Asp-tRNA(Asn)/Glu-tRNA(Gln) amidotransferase subunit GatC [Thermodesulfobacteriota bacterium]